MQKLTDILGRKCQVPGGKCQGILHGGFNNILRTIGCTVGTSLLLLSQLVGMTACTDEIISVDDNGPQTGLIEDPVEGYALGFKVTLDKDLSTRASDVEAYDNYIDTRDKFRVLFFTENGDFLFGAVDRTVTYLTDQNDYTKDTWYVRVPMNYIVDRDGNVYDAEAIRNYLRTNNFKVAILANWPNNGVIKPGDDENSELDFTYINREPNWGYRQSYLYTQVYDDKNEDHIKIGPPDPKNINNLHHLVPHSYYDDDSGSTSRPKRNEVYDFIMEKNEKGQGMMGVRTDWVTNRINFGEGDARVVSDAWIRKNINPQTQTSVAEPLYEHYDLLWQLWDFNAAYRSTDEIKNSWGQVTTAKNYSAYSSWGEEWFHRNGSLIKDWMAGYYNYNRNITTPTTIDHLTFVPGDPTTDSESQRNANTYVGYSTIKYSNGKYGLSLPLTTYVEKVNGSDIYRLNTSDSKASKTKGYLTFKAPGTGTLRVEFSGGKLFVQRNTDPVNNYTSSFKLELSITGDSEDIYLWSGDPNTPCVIHSIEWVSDKYLYDTDRQGVAPSLEQPIPMYGVQNYSKLMNWEEGTTFDISKDNSDSKPITLIRSLAKVVLYLPQKASYIFMRSMNRTATCEPMDVETPTDWGEHNSSECEWFRIQDYGSNFSSLSGSDLDTELSTYDELDSYTNWLSWFYKSWTTAKWYPPTSGNGNYSGWNFQTHNSSGKAVTNNKENPPHIFFPDINRSDFCEMIYCGEESGRGHKYILYMPDKHISDPNYVGVNTCLAKIPHIEFRYERDKSLDKMSNTRNFEDNKCKRIYFTDYNSNTVIQGLKQDQYDMYYERNLKPTGNKNTTTNKYPWSYDGTLVNKHWPIMRNHVYEFQVKGTNASSPTDQTIQVSVNDWGSTNREVVTW